MPSDLELALEMLADESTPIQRELLLYLSGVGREEEKRFLICLQKMGEERRRSLVAELVAYSTAKFDLDYVALFRCCLMDSDAQVRKSAIEGLWEDERSDLVRPLLRLCASDPSAEVRAAAAASLGRFVYLGECDGLRRDLANAIRRALEGIVKDSDEDALVVRRALESLAYVNDDAVRLLIDQAYEHSDPGMRQSAVCAMGRSADRFWTETVLDELGSGGAAMRYEAARACGEMELQRAVDPLIELLTDSDAQVRDAAIWALGQIGGKRAQRALQRCLQSGDSAVVAAADEALDVLNFGARSFDLFVHQPNATDTTTLGPADTPEPEDQVADTTAGDTDWPDEFLEIG